MIKQDIVNRVAEQLSITKVKAEIAVESVFGSLKNALKRGERIELRGFGVFIVSTGATLCPASELVHSSRRIRLLQR